MSVPVLCTNSAFLAITYSYSVLVSLPVSFGLSASLSHSAPVPSLLPALPPRCHGNRRRLKLRGVQEGRARVVEGGAEQVGVGESRERPGLFGLRPGGEAVKSSGWSLLGKAEMPGRDSVANGLIHWSMGRGEGGQCGRGRGSEWAVSGRRRGLRGRWAGSSLLYRGSWATLGKGRGFRAGYPDRSEGGADPAGRGVVPSAERRHGSRGL